MKKIFIGILILAASSTLSAQQKPSFNDYLEKTRSLAPLNLPVSHRPFNKRFGDAAEKLMTRIANRRPMTLDEAKLYDILPNGNKLYRLPMDNMICIVPDMSPFHMPVVRGTNFGDKSINVFDN